MKYPSRLLKHRSHLDPIALQKIPDRQSPSSFELNFTDAITPFSRFHLNDICSYPADAPVLSLRVPLPHFPSENLEESVFPLGIGSRPWVEGAHLSVDLFRFLTPVDPSIFLLD